MESCLWKSPGVTAGAGWGGVCEPLRPAWLEQTLRGEGQSQATWFLLQDFGLHSQDTERLFEGSKGVT